MACERRDGDFDSRGGEQRAVDLGRPCSGCEDEAGAGEGCLLVGGGVEDAYGGEGAGWGAGD